MLRERNLMVLQYSTYEEMKKTRYHNILREDITEFIRFLACQTLEDMIARA